MTQMNVTYDVKETRPFLKFQAIAPLLTLAFLVVGAFALIVAWRMNAELAGITLGLGPASGIPVWAGPLGHRGGVRHEADDPICGDNGYPFRMPSTPLGTSGLTAGALKLFEKDRDAVARGVADD